MAELWYYTCEGKQMEPVTVTELRQLASTGFLRSSDLVWKDGMAQWVKASTIDGLIPPAAAKSSRSAPAESRRSRSREVDDEAPPPRRRRRSEDDDYDDDFDDDRSRRRRKAPAKGISGLALGLIIGGVVLGLLIVVVVIAVIASSRPGRNPPIAQKRINIGPAPALLPIAGPTRTENLGLIQPGFSWQKNIVFPQAKLVEVSVNSDNPANDVDLFVYQNNVLVACDIAVWHTCRLNFFAQPNTSYRIEVKNLGDSPFPANCTITYTQP